MKQLKPVIVCIEEVIGVNKFNVDEGNAHIQLSSSDYASLPTDEFGKLIRVCPAGLYKEDEDGNRFFDFAGCLECGTCRIACEDTIISKWELPRSTMGVIYRFG